MTTPDPVDANLALWSHYFERAWPAFPDPLVRRFVARAAGTGMAWWLALLQGPEVGRLFAENAPGVSAFATQTGWQSPDAIPEEFLRADPVAQPRPPIQATQFTAPWREAVAIG